LVGGVELVADKQTGQPFEPSQGVGQICAEHAHEGGLLTRPLGDTIALCPPLIITADQIDELFGKLETALDRTLEQVSDQLST
ncbi:MAG: aspartate aminotransferase family protein, partial [Rhodospirillaceae bacterium]|nr:aspartate aminotransferase family protein [Rhodospirillaceae bacterium]